jgi:hypothetical protein
LKKIVILVVLQFYFVLPLFSQELLPFVENYSKSNFEGDNQIWNVVQGRDKAMYFANNHYLLRYDGVKWEKYTLPNKTIIRSVFVDGDKIYSGSYKEFGYWYRKGAKMHYVSISKKKGVFFENESDEIWKIFKLNDSIYFQSFNKILIFDGKKIIKRNLPFLISYSFIINNEIVLASVQNGVYKMTKDSFKKIEGLKALENNVIHAIEMYRNKIYFFTKKNGVFIQDNGVLSAWKSPLNSVLKIANINVAKFIKNNKLIIGTGNKGVFIFDLLSGTYKNINRNNVLMNNSVLSLTQDKEDNLWLGLDNGIALLEVNSPISIFYDKSGILGSVYSVASTSKGYLMASNHGIFEYKNQHLSLLDNTQGQAWNISKIGTNYVIGHNEGTFLYKNGVFSKSNSVSGGWDLVKSNVDNFYIQSTYSGISIYRDLDNLENRIVVDSLLSPIKYASQNRKNEIWAADNYRGLYRVILNDAFETVKVENITQKSNIKNDFGVKIFEFRNEILYLIDNKWYTFNAITNQLETNTIFNYNFKNVTDIVGIDQDHFMIIQDGLLYHVAVKGNKFVKNSISEKYYKGKLINDNLRIFKDKNNYLLNLDDGFMSLELDYLSSPKTNINIEVFNNGKLVNGDTSIKYNSELKLYIITGIYGANQPYLFYKIENSKTITPVKSGMIVLNNLVSGSHQISIYRHDGSSYFKIKSVEFTVANPWYFSFWMILLYCFLLGAILFFYYKWNLLRYNQKLALREEELRHQKKILEIELKAENELNIQEYEKHILELEVQTKSSEVAGKSLSIAKQSEMIDNIQAILDSEMDFNKLKSEIKKAIKINAVNKHEWENFEVNLNHVHKDFIKILSVKFPNLTPKDIKLCIYLKMNLSSKEIAPLMNITFRGVELHRYRLRKKLSLSQEENLIKFLLSI